MRALDWSADGGSLLAAYEDGTVCGWRAGTGSELFADRAASAPTLDNAVSRALACSPQDATFAVHPGGDVIEIRATGDGRVLTTLAAPGTVKSLRWRGDGKALAASFRSPARIVIWSAVTWDEVASVAAPGRFLYGLAWSRDGARLATAHNDHSIAIWSVEPLEEVERFRRAHAGDVLWVDWSPDGSRLASGGQDGLVKVWNPSDACEAPLSLSGHSHVVRQVRWSPDGSCIASASQDGAVKVWDPAVSSGEDRRGIEDATWSADGRWLALVRTNAVGVFASDTGERLSVLETGDRFESASFDPSGRFLLALAMRDVIVVWDWEKQHETGRLEGRHGGASRIRADWSPDGRWFAAGGVDGVPRVWNAATLELVRELEPHDHRIGAVAWSPDGSLLATSAADSRVMVWEMREWRLLHVLERQRRVGNRKYWTGPDNLSWSPGGDRLAAAASEKTGLTVWDMPRGRPVLRIEGHASGVRAFAWSADGTRLATGGFDRQVKIWDADTGDELLTLDCDCWAPQVVEWHPDGSRLLMVSKDGRFRLWDARPGYDLSSSRGHEE